MEATKEVQIGAETDPRSEISETMGSTALLETIATTEITAEGESVFPSKAHYWGD